MRSTHDIKTDIANRKRRFDRKILLSENTNRFSLASKQWQWALFLNELAPLMQELFQSERHQMATEELADRIMLQKLRRRQRRNAA